MLLGEGGEGGGAVINANGNGGMNPQTLGKGIVGSGGGAGGVIPILLEHCN